MTEAYVFREDWNCVLLRATGERDIRAYRSLVAALKADPRIRPGYLRLTDVRAVDPLPSPQFTRSIASVMAELETSKPVGKAAILVREEVQYGMLRVYQAHLTEAADRMQVFRNLPDACRWLGLPPDIPDPFTSGEWRPEWSSSVS